VASPKEVGGLGVPNLRLLNLALCCRCTWLQRVDSTKAWVEFNLHIPHLSRSFFEPAMAVIVCDAERALFWKDRWLYGACVRDNAPNLVALGGASSCMLKDGLLGKW
jgi:hypothetical protein